MFRILKNIIQYKNIPEVYICQRFKGHSKWQNIRHIKAAKDAEKSTVTQMYIKKIKYAISDNGETNPDLNDKLAKVIEQAKKNDIPMESIRNYLKKVKDSNKKVESKFIAIKGPGGIVVLLHLLTDNIKATRMLLNGVVKKWNLTIMDPVPKGMFTHKGVVITNALKNVENAEDDAIVCDAEEVEEVEDEDTKYLRFVCHPHKLMIVRTMLEKNNYEVIKMEEEFIPINFININEDQEQVLEKLYSKLEQVEEVAEVYNNVQ